MDLKPETKKLLERMERCSMLPYRWNEAEIVKNLKEIYRLVGLRWPEKYIVCGNIFAGMGANASARAMARMGANASARAMARGGAMAWAMAIDWDFDYFLYDFEDSEKADPKFLEIMEYALRAKEAGLGYLADDPNGVLYLAPNPVVRMNSRGQFHSAEFPAIEWETRKEYFLNGVRFPPDLWQRVVSKSMPFEEMLAIADVDQRTQAMKYGDTRKFLEYTKSVLLDSRHLHRSKYELWKIPKEAGIFIVDAYQCVFRDPITNLEYMSGIEPKVGEKGDVLEAMAWKRRMSKEMFMRAVYA